LVALADDLQRAVTFGQGEVGQVRAAGFGDPQRVQCQQAGEGVVVSATVAGASPRASKVAGVQLDVRSADLGERVQPVLTAPGEPQKQLCGVRLPGPR
jgi:hypothetical protein